ncbi:MAG TPA: hypothetical protein VOB72_13595 [Candidatus Dormibacteraeota bacterium]|nr:hypothetical protein [Candidatus Dormibacteraeota bacterium]
MSDPRAIRSVVAGLRSHPPLLLGIGIALLVVTGIGAFAAAGAVRLGLATLVAVEAIALAAWLIARPRRREAGAGRTGPRIRISARAEVEDNEILNAEGDGPPTGEFTAGFDSRVRRNRIGNQGRRDS